MEVTAVQAVNKLAVVDVISFSRFSNQSLAVEAVSIVLINRNTMINSYWKQAVPEIRYVLRRIVC